MTEVEESLKNVIDTLDAFVVVHEVMLLENTSLKTLIVIKSNIKNMVSEIRVKNTFIKMASKFLGPDNTVEQFVKDCEERLVKLDNMVIVIGNRIIELTATITPVVFTHNKPFQITDKNGWLAYRLYDKWNACEFCTDALNEDVRVFSTTGEKMFACTMAYRNNTFRVFDRKEDCVEYVKSKNEDIESEGRVLEHGVICLGFGIEI